LGGPEELLVGILFSISGDVTGMIMFLLHKEFAHMVLNSLVGSAFDGYSELDEMDKSTIQEVGNIMAASYINAMAALTGLTIDLSVPTMNVDMAGALLSVPAIYYANISDKIILIEDEFAHDQAGASSHILLIPEFGAGFMSKTIAVGISDYNIASIGDVLVTYALGSCVGICLYDPVSKLAGLSHIMLPTVADFSDSRSAAQLGKYADTAIELLIQQMLGSGAVRIRIRAKIAGGAQMFAPVNNTSLAGIGERNVIAVKKELARLRVPIVAEDTGKNYGRTVYFGAVDGLMTVKSVNKGEWVY